jgi:N-(5'phosphoribosyl)anthranilate (PRA) isomerase
MWMVCVEIAYREEQSRNPVMVIPRFAEFVAPVCFDPMAMCVHRAEPARFTSRVSRRLVEVADRPVILAGGLTTENVRRAILEVRPTGVDCHTGVEDSSGRKSREKVRKFLSEAYEAFEIVKAK